MQVAINGENIDSEQALHQALRDRLDFGPYYGSNLAALRDRLSNDLDRPIHLIWRNIDLSRKLLGDEIVNRVVEIFESVAAQDEAFGWDDRFTFTAQ